MRDDKLIEAMARGIWKSRQLRLLREDAAIARLDFDDLPETMRGVMLWDARAALAALRERSPAAWLITGSSALHDAVVISEATAARRLAERGDDGSRKVPLYAAPQPEEAP